MGVSLHWHPHPFTSILAPAHSDLVLTGGEEGVVVLWYPNSQQPGFIPRVAPAITHMAVSADGVRLVVCYDLRFPVWSRNRGDYDAAIYVASWPSPRVEAWKALLRARAIENQCYVLGVNRVGKDPYCEYSGGTAGIDPYGRTLSACADGEEGFAEVVIDMEELQSFRKKFPVLNDADSFTLN